MKQRILGLLAGFVIASISYAQQLPISSFYDMHGVMHNPATAGVSKNASVGATFRKQWSGIDGGPQTTMVYANTHLQDGKTGLGGYLFNDVTGPLRNTGLQLAYSYIIPLKGNSSFSLGIEGRAQQFSYDRQKLAASLGAADPAITGKEKRIKGDAGFGIAYTTSKLQVGASVSQLVQSKLNLYEGSGNTTGEAQFYRHFYLHGKYDLKIDDYTHMYPNFLLVYVPNAPTEFQGGVRVEHNDVFWYGLSLRAHQSWMFSAGFKIKEKLNIGYSFDVYRTPISLFDNGSNAHEVMLRYAFMK
ncbi:MAG: hypothetical protein JWP88_1520 [Flaviaesturariibacter sp.]|nr:hypothetical protein [Flaviaesturariibacter sp.]